MKHALAALLLYSALASGAPLALHPENPHYFLFRGKPAVLITSAEHYGAVLNGDFDFRKYLATLASDRLNLTRVFSGSYREVPGSFRITNNTLAPKHASYIAPWQRSSTPGAVDGLNKFDLNKWDENYFKRLKEFMQEADKQGVVVEFVLFCPFYRDEMWDHSPMNARNNINGTGDLKRQDALSLDNGSLLAFQEEMVRKIVSELREFDNLYYEICNEPYAVKVSLEWERRIASVIAKTEPGRLIAQNISNGSVKIENPDPAVSLFNFHYSRPPLSVGMNYHLNKAIGNNETGFDGTADVVYRIQGWEFILAGGALYNNLDYSFTVGHEDGTFQSPPSQPGGGSVALRRQLRVLRDFMDRLQFTRMAPAHELVSNVPEGASAWALAEPGKQYAIYLHHGKVVPKAKPRYVADATEKTTTVQVDLAGGQYEAAWIDTRTGRTLHRERFRHAAGRRAMTTPRYSEDIALRIVTM
jgi:hypothetical protein